MSNHTPGPWKVMFSTPKVGECTLSVWPADTVDGYVGSPICKVSPEHLMNGTDEANARLIAAAPELLEALQFCQSVIKSQGMWDRSEQLAYEKASLAIAKATSEKEVQS